MTPKVVRELQLLRHELLGPPRKHAEEGLIHEPVTSAA